VFEDHFGNHADAYRRHRPAYPDTLFARLAAAVPQTRVAWDAACGSGQAATSLSAIFDTVIGCDGSLAQLVAAQPDRRFSLVRAWVEAPPLPDHSVDLVTVAQALHWLDLPAFYRAVERVVRPGGAIAAWCYTLPTLSHALDPLIVHFHDEVVGPYWPARRRHVLRAYRDLAFPFPRIAAPTLALRATWRADNLLGYLGTWSAARRYAAATGRDPLRAIASQLHRAWGSEKTRMVRWPLHLLLGRVGA